MPGANELKAAETQALSGSTGFYSGNGKTPKNKVKLSGKKGKYGALGLTLAIMLGAGVWLGSSNSLLLGALSSQLSTVTQTDAASTQITRISKLSNMIRNKKTTSYVDERFAKNGIVSNGDGTYTWNGQTVNGDNFSKLYDTDVEFRDSVNNSTFSNVANRYDNMANDAITSRTGYNTRNAFRNYEESGDADTNIKNFNDVAEGQFKNKYSTDMSDTSSRVIENVEEVDGETHKTLDIQTDDVKAERGTTTSDPVTARTQAEGIISRLSSNVSRFINFSCTALELGSMVATTIAGLQTYQSIQAYWTLMEPVDKTIAGQGNASGINALLNRLTNVETTTRTDPSITSITEENYSNYNIGGTGMSGNRLEAEVSAGNLAIDATEVTETGSALDDPNLIAMLSGTAFNKQAASSYSLEASLKSLFKSLAFFGVSHKTCAALNATIAASHLAVPVIGLAVSLMPGGAVLVSGAMAWNFLKDSISSLVKSAIVSFAVGGILAFMIPELQKSLTNFVELAVGMPLGAYFARSAGAANSSVAQIASGATISGSEALLAYQQVQKDYLAQQAEVDRLNHSPFDITNKNTFLGSIAYSLLPTSLGTSNNSTISTILKTTSSSIANITNSAIAEGEGTEYINTFGDCPNLESIGAKGDIYCNPIVIHDTSTLNTTFDNDPKYKEIITNSLECIDGICSIKSNSNLAKFTSYCANRTSPFGVVDAAILQDLQAGNVIADSIPYLDDAIDIFNATQEEENLAWANGSFCVNNADNVDQSDMVREFWNKEGKYYQHYIQQERVDEQLGVYEGTRSTVSRYREEYLREHPIDNSPAGIIASVSGLSTENAQLVLDVLAYYEFIENYDPSTRLAMNDDIYRSSDELSNDFHKTITLNNSADVYSDTYLHNQQYVIYADIRNRSYAI